VRAKKLLNVLSRGSLIYIHPETALMGHVVVSEAIVVVVVVIVVVVENDRKTGENDNDHDNDKNIICQTVPGWTLI
jgi:hypothetical protein